MIGALGLMLPVPAIWLHGVRADHRVLRGRDLLVRGVLDRDPQPSGRYFPDRVGRLGQRHGGTGAGLGTIAAIYLAGWVADRYSFAPILFGASVVPLVALAAMLLLVRNTAATRGGIVREI